MDDKVVVSITLKTLIELHALWGKDGVNSLLATAKDEAMRQISFAIQDGTYARVSKKMNFDLIQQSKKAKDKNV